MDFLPIVCDDPCSDFRDEQPYQDLRDAIIEIVRCGECTSRHIKSQLGTFNEHHYATIMEALCGGAIERTREVGVITYRIAPIVSASISEIDSHKQNEYERVKRIANQSTVGESFGRL